MNSVDGVSGLSQNLLLGLLWLFLIVSMIGTVVMIILLIKRGDERKRLILNKSAISAFITAVILFVIHIIWKIFFEQESSFGLESNPAIYLGLVSIVFNTAYLINSRKYQ
ncbi:hypothetical protein [Facklamia miroungae]|uniref:Uncharacterized protein n=1 Tax=Facklamia miroungae TaxID=120956 RepID=A0A1G7PVM1_9LACT|nr:hypothetical protein [Facklamia miroungae]NKZ28847.1 hypothetical protein [Facklamia miroungae]SDF90367.1 hypothetical protein SAMN05421791_101392 [Facklamia miroungae]